MSDARAENKPELVRVGAGRGPAYPYISLQTAIERVDAIREANIARTAVSPTTYYRVWGYKGESGASRQTLAALNHFGLVEYVGRGENRQLRLSDLALRIIFDRVPDSSARRAAIREAALHPAIHRRIMDRYGVPTPPDYELETFLMRDSEYSEQAARNVIGIYRETLTYAGLEQPDSMPSSEGPLLEEKPKAECPVPEVGDLIQVEIDGSLALPRPARVRAIHEHEGHSWVFIEGSETGIPMDQVVVEEKGKPVAPPLLPLGSPVAEIEQKPGTRREVFALDEGDVVLTFPDNLSSDSYADLESYFQLFLRKAKRRAIPASAKSLLAQPSEAIRRAGHAEPEQPEPDPEEY